MSNNLTILLYHGVTSCKSHGIENYSGKHIKVEEFEKQMRFLRDNANVLSMDDIVDISISGGDYPENAVAITFDDGFENNYTQAAPILDDYKLPATFYITSGIVNTTLMFWVDKLEDMINLTEKKLLRVKLNEEKDFPLIGHDEKLEALNTIKKFCKFAEANEMYRIIAELEDKLSVSPSVAHASNYKKINWDQLSSISSNPLFIIGGHSLYHNILSSMDEECMDKDIQLSIDLLEYNLGKNIVHYSYPEGQKEHYNQAVINSLKNRGIKCSPSAIHGVNYKNEYDLFNFRRIMVGFLGSAFPLAMR